MSEPRSLHELGVVSGLTQGQVRAAVDLGVVDEDVLTWVDALVLRVFLPIQTMLLAGEVVPVHTARPLRSRTHAAVQLVREAVASGYVGRHAVMTVGRQSVSLQPSLEAVALDARTAVYGDGVLALPVGQWWADLRWRHASRLS